MIEQIRFSLLKFPIKSRPDSRFGPVVLMLKLAALMFLSLLIVPAFTLFGYALRVREASFRGDEYLPPVKGFINLTREGVYGVSAALPYTIILTIIWVVILTAMGMASISQTILNGFTAFMFAVGFYGFPGLLTVYAAERDVHGLYTKETLDFIMNESYGLGAVIYALMWVVLGTLILFSVVTVVGFLLFAPFALLVRNAFLGQVGQEVQTEYPNVSGKPVNFYRDNF